jgi:hypothetical protein
MEKRNIAPFRVTLTVSLRSLKASHVFKNCFNCRILASLALTCDGLVGLSYGRCLLGALLYSFAKRGHILSFQISQSWQLGQVLYHPLDYS